MQSDKDEKAVTNPKSMFSFLSKPITYFNSEWSFAQFRILDNHAICAMKDRYIITLTLDGNYYVGEMDPKNGGECKKIYERPLISEA